MEELSSQSLWRCRFARKTSGSYIGVYLHTEVVVVVLWGKINHTTIMDIYFILSPGFMSDLEDIRTVACENSHKASNCIGIDHHVILIIIIFPVLVMFQQCWYLICQNLRNCGIHWRSS